MKRKTPTNVGVFLVYLNSDIVTIYWKKILCNYSQKFNSVLLLIHTILNKQLC